MKDTPPPENLPDLLRRSSVADLSDEAALHWTGVLIDLAGDAHDLDALRVARRWTNTLEQRELSHEHRALLHYFCSNAIELERLIHRKGWDQRDWEQPELEEEVVHLRLALEHAASGDLPTVREAQILTNLGNTISHHGRLVEAVQLWKRALGALPEHGMAMMNLGYGLVQYSGLQMEKVPARVLGIAGYKLLVKSLAYPLADATRRFAQQLIDRIEEGNPGLESTREPPVHEHSLGESEAERAYRRWALGHGLFLNPLNELGPESMAGEDVLVLPWLTTPARVGPYLLAFFAQMKQEFVSARFLFYEGATASTPHFSDRHVLVPNTFDRPALSLSTEKLKTAFRAAYSLLDKVSFFLNDYLELGIAEHRVDFRRVWFVNQERKKGLRWEFAERRGNFPLQGLFWLSKDLFEDAPGFDRPMDPKGHQIWELRNCIEHRYVKLLRREVPEASGWDGSAIGEDRLAYRISVEEFRDLTLRLLHMARAALIYLALAVGVEEHGRGDERGRVPVPTFPLTPLPFSERV